MPDTLQVSRRVKCIIQAAKVGMGALGIFGCGKTAFVKVLAKETQHLSNAQALVELTILPAYDTAEQKCQVAHFKGRVGIVNFLGAEFYLIFAHALV